MSRRKRWKLDLLSGEAAALVLLGASFFLGGAAGCVMAGLVGGEGQGALAEYIRGYLDLAAEGGMQPPFWPLVWELIRFPLLVFLLGFTALGVVGMPVLFAVRGFLLCFAAASFVVMSVITAVIIAVTKKFWLLDFLLYGKWKKGALKKRADR